MNSASIEDVTEFVLDGTHGSPVRTETGIPVLSAQNVKDGALDYATDRYTSAAEYDAFKKRLPLAAGDVLLTIVGTIGRAAVLGAAQPLVFQRSVAVLRPRGDRLCPRFLYHASQSQAFQAQLARSSNQSSQAGVYLGKLKKLRIPLPPLPEQRRIAEILDKADALRAKRRTALTQLDSLTQSIFLDMFGDPATNPKGWPREPLGQLAETTSGGTPSRDVEEYFGGPFPWVKSGELHEGVVMATEESLTERGLAESSAKLMPVGTVLVAMYGATVGAVAVLGIEAATNQAVCCISPSERLMADYLAPFLHWSTPALLAKRVGGAQPNLSQDLLRKLVVPVPPRELQVEFAGRVGRLESVCDRMAAAAAKCDQLFASLQHKAFSGDLHRAGEGRLMA